MLLLLFLEEKFRPEYNVTYNNYLKIIIKKIP